MARQTNKLKWIGELLLIGETINETTDRIEITTSLIRKINYNNVGVTSTDKFTSKDENEIVKKIEVRIDRNIEDNQKNYRIGINNRIYNIQRIYVREEEGIMEVSLAYDD